MSCYADRCRNLAAEISATGCQAAILTYWASIRYLSGFNGSSGVLWVPVVGNPILITDFRYDEQAKSEVEESFDIRIVSGGWISNIEDMVASANGSVAFESEHVTVSEHEALKEAFPQLSLIASTDLVGRLRRIKDAKEIEGIEHAITTAEAALQRTLTGIDWTDRPSEKRVAGYLEAELRAGGSEHLPFEVIVASGPRTSLPHATPSDRCVVSGDLLLIDFGARFQSYCSDITRNFVIGSPRDWQVALHNQVLDAHEQACAAVGPGVLCRFVDTVAREALVAHQVDQYFGHSTGHGIGLEVHESPSLSQRSEQTLEVGNVVTIEPGVYLPARGGVRIEDDILVEPSGFRRMTSLSRALIEL